MAREIVPEPRQGPLESPTFQHFYSYGEPNDTRLHFPVTDTTEASVDTNWSFQRLLRLREVILASNFKQTKKKKIQSNYRASCRLNKAFLSQRAHQNQFAGILDFRHLARVKSLSCSA